MLTKRIFDFLLALLTVITLSWLIFVFWVLAAIDTKSSGFFLQERVGQYGKIYKIFKLRSIGEKEGKAHVSAYGKLIRKTKIDELPQFFNVLLGDMSIVGPRPDIPGYYDRLEGENRKILELKPGLTSAAALKYANEETLLNLQQNPLAFNDTVIFPDKVRMNLHYYHNRTFKGDLKILLQTFAMLIKSIK